ncbi:MAG: Z1 domain-containing protein [Defluviitaleaceae bacterium]|nr:Z1 domain-containing protein [Defluviitaleaceae bacterium]
MSHVIPMSILPSCETVWIINRDGHFKEKIAKQLLQDDIPQNAVDMIFDNAAEVLGQCPNPHEDSPDAKTGIVIGKVQSGKTSNFVALTALSFDSGYAVNIVLGGNKNNLLDQNVERIKSYYKETGASELVVLHTRQHRSLLSNAQAMRDFLDEGRKIIIVGLKHTKHINQISSIFQDVVLRDVPVLIIDDEGDQATLNTRASIAEMSSIYEAVVNLKSSLTRHCFISVTATPQANILIATWDALSPDFGILVYPGDEYCGLHEFHGENQDTYIKVIPDDESSLLDEEGVPNSFYDALATFFVGGALRRYRGDSRHHSMLIHPSQKKFEHSRVLDKVRAIVNDWREKAREIADGIEDISSASLSDQLNENYNRLKFDGALMPSYNELHPYIIDCIKQCGPPHLCNSDEDASRNAELYKYNIFVGGNMVERGITIKGLAVTYIIRRARGVANVDNTEQRARWFGYKKSYLDVCRVYTTQAIKEDFASIYEHEDDLWSSIERAQAKGVSFKDIPRIFVLANRRLNLTRRNVARAERFDFSEWTKQDYLVLEGRASQKNDDLIAAYKNQLLDSLEQLVYSNVNTHSIVRDIDYFELNRVLLGQLEYPSESRIDTGFFNKLEEVLRKIDVSPIVDIVWIRDEAGQERSLRPDGQINQLFQGRNPNKASSTYYPGDGAMVLPERSRVMQLQIHRVKAKNRPNIDFHSAALALYIPLEYAEKMDRIVGQI